MSDDDHFAKWEAAPEEEKQVFLDGLRAFRTAVRERGEVLAEEALQHPSTRRRITGSTDRRVTAGPYAESIEQIGGLYLVELPDLDTALEIAARLPAPVVDVFPVLDVSAGG